MLFEFTETEVTVVRKRVTLKFTPGAKLIYCKHCREWKEPRRRGLCADCYRNQNIRKHYPPAYYREELPAYFGEPLTPTDAAPGSEAKIRVMAERAAMGLGIFHPRDRRIDLR